MTTLNQLRKECGYSTPKVEGLFGIEIETEVKERSLYPKGFLIDHQADDEGHMIYKNPMKNWTTKSDGSLRDFGVEYILTKPLSLEGAFAALDEFYQMTLEVPFSKDQPSTSVHVHVNFTDRTLLTMANFVTIWTHFENVLLDFSGPTRKSNCFALGARLAEQQVTNLIKMFSGIQDRNCMAISFEESQTKYAALNIANLGKLGTLEARSFRGTTDVEEIKTWCSILHRILVFSETPGLTPALFLSDWGSRGVELMSDVFGPYSGMLKCDGYEAMIERQEFYTYMLVTSVKDWMTFGLAFEAPKAKARWNKKETMNNSLLSTSPWSMTSTVSVISPGTVYTDEQTDDVPMPAGDYEGDDDFV